jgi:hypothetical protein
VPEERNVLHLLAISGETMSDSMAAAQALYQKFAFTCATHLRWQQSVVPKGVGRGCLPLGL